METGAGIKKYYHHHIKDHSIIFELSIQEIVKYVQSHFKNKESRVCLHDDTEITKLLDKIKIHNANTNIALNDHDLRLLRQGIVDQIASVYSFVYATQDVDMPCTNQFSYTAPRSYADYCSHVNDAVNELIHLPVSISTPQSVQHLVNQLVVKLMNLPKFSQFNIKEDFIDLALASLTGVGPLLSYNRESTIWK